MIHEITLGKAYYFQGFFNVGRKMSEFLGPHKSSIIIRLGGVRGELIEGYVNRTAQINGDVRIMAGINYTKWVQEVFKQGDTMVMEVINNQEILLRKPM